MDRCRVWPKYAAPSLLNTKGSDIMRTKKGFTLIELLVVISIIALLLSILLPSLQRVKMLTRRVVCSSNLRQQGIAFGVYGADFGKYPPHVYQLWQNGSLVGSHWPFGGMAHIPEGGSEYEPAGQACLLAAEYITDPEFFYCPSLRKSDFLSYEAMFEEYQQDYLQTNQVEDIDWYNLFLSYPYWVDYKTGRVHEDRNLKRSVADSPSDRSGKVLATDIIAINGFELPDFGDFSDAFKYPHRFANHKQTGVMEGGCVLKNDGSVTWEDFRSMQEDWGTLSPLSYDRLRFVYSANDKILFWF